MSASVGIPVPAAGAAPAGPPCCPSTRAPSATAVDTATPPDTTTLIGRLASGLARGERRAIRDLATLLDRPTDAPAVRDLLERYTFFGDRIDVRTCGRQPLLDFFYRNIDSLRYSELLNAFLVESLERQETRYSLVGLDAYQRSDRSMHLRKYVGYTEEAVAGASVADLRDLAEKIADLQLVEGQAYLLGWLSGEPGRLLATDLDAFLHYLDQLMLRPSPEVAEALFESERRGYLRSGSLAAYLSRLCNVPFEAWWETAEHQARYADLVDSLGSLARVREFGYARSVGFSHAHFREPVDYYGRILSRAHTPDYVHHNALIDLVETQHPRALFYLGTQFLAAREGRTTAYPAVHYLYLLRKLSNLGVSVADGRDRLVFQLDVAGDREAWRNFVRYWAGHYDDYEYDEHRGSFVNRHDQSLETENLERYFRLLNSEREEVALQAYERLTRADPIEVEQLVVKYRDLLRTTHPKVPSLKDGHLEHVAQLTAYCMRNRVDFEAGPALRARLDSLLEALDPRDRIALEDRILGTCTLPDLTRIEYWAALHQYHLEAGYSVGRILDYGYSAHWEALLASDAQLRLFLKKAMLFSRMEGMGISDSYLRKFDVLDARARARVEALITSESDRHIARSLRRILALDDQRQHRSLTDVDDFLETPEAYTLEELAELPAPTLEQLSELLARSGDGSNPKARHLYRTYLEAHLGLDLVPDLMSLLIRDDHPEKVAGLLSDIYHYRWADREVSQPQAWLAMWRERSPSYRDWGATFYDEHIAALRAAERVTGPELNAVLTSPRFDPADRALVLASLAKLSSARHLLMLRFEPALSWGEHPALDALELSYKDLQDIDKLFGDARPRDLVDYIFERAEGLDAEDRGRLVNALMRKPWTEDLLDDPEFASADAWRAALLEYLEASTTLTEFEEQNTALNLARLDFIGLSPIERLRASTTLPIDEAARLQIQDNILRRLGYGDVAEALRVYPQLGTADGRRPANFLNQDFGLPIFELSSAAVIDTFCARHARLSPRDLYLVYLEEFGLGLTRPDGALDYGRIYRILNYDIVLPFIGAGGNRRDLYAYGVIRLLELDEGTRLGFHEKLNENQTFYTYTASKRATAWVRHLVDSGRVHPDQLALRPSFNAAAGS